MDEIRIWWPYLYQYGVGLVIFGIGIWLILASGACRLSRRSDRFWFGVLIFGFIWYASIHFLWYEAALNIMPEAGARAKSGHHASTTTQPAEVEDDIPILPESEVPHRLPGTGPSEPDFDVPTGSGEGGA